MPKSQPTTQGEYGLAGSTGVLVVNLGTPEAATTGAVRRYLKQFLSDPRVVEYPRLLWWLVLNLVILRIRPRRSAAAYQKIWTNQGSPLLVNSTRIVDKLRDRLTSRCSGQLRVELAMTYGTPSIAVTIDKLLSAGVNRILVVPLYPQYSGTTTASVFDAVAKKLGQLRCIPETQFVNGYHDARGYIDALAKSIRDDWAKHGRGNKLLMSFHGLPEKNSRNGDPYQSQCQATARLLADALKLRDEDWILAFQSRVGREKWLSPYTDVAISTLGEQGLSRLDVVCPGFSADCLETLEEIEMQNAALFTAAGGETLHYIPALNARDEHIAFLVALIEQRLAGWAVAANIDAETNTQSRTVSIGAAS